jgi:hypothetical protein
MKSASTKSQYVVALLAVALAACSSAPKVPPVLAPAPGDSLAMIVAAEGVQIYECRARKDAPGQYEWAFVGPQAELRDIKGRKVGEHGIGPYWQANDGSKVTGTVKARSDAPVAGAIPWLLLDTAPAGPEGRFSRVRSIQRVNTLGGVAPAYGCTGASVGTSARVAYLADYYLYTGR